MKKLLSLIFCLSLSLPTLALSMHLTFMGIPLDGTIESFQSKLIKKGCSLNSTLSKASPLGARAFKGTFIGEEADIFVYYNIKSKVVYRAKAVMNYGESLLEQKYDKFVSLLKTKYASEYINTDEQEGHESLLIVVSNEDGTCSTGIIGVYVSKPDLPSIYGKYLHIDYQDALNYKDNQDDQMNDL